MKKLLFSALILSSAFFAGSCTDKAVEKEKVATEEFDKEKFYSQTPYWCLFTYQKLTGLLDKTPLMFWQIHSWFYTVMLFS
jgi:hypothetical protein